MYQARIWRNAPKVWKVPTLQQNVVREAEPEVKLMYLKLLLHKAKLGAKNLHRLKRDDYTQMIAQCAIILDLPQRLDNKVLALENDFASKYAIQLLLNWFSFRNCCH